MLNEWKKNWLVLIRLEAWKRFFFFLRANFGGWCIIDLLSYQSLDFDIRAAATND